MELAWRRLIPPVELLETLGTTMEEASTVLSRITKADLLSTFHIQGYTVSETYAVYQVVEHFGMHYGQILYITKLALGRNLNFYPELDKTGRA